MSEETVVGHLEGARDQFNIEWQVENFLSLSKEVGKRYHSPMFFFCNSSWYLRLHPNGQKWDGSEGYIGVYVMRGDSGTPVPVTHSLYLKKTDGRKVIWEEIKHTFRGKDDGLGIPKVIGRLELVCQKSVFLPSGVLTLICCLKCDETQVDKAKLKTVETPDRFIEASTQTQSNCTDKLSRDFSGLLLSGEDSDLTVKVKDVEFCLHRGIVGARTPVFSAMFRHDMKEKATGVVSIDDCEVDVFRAFVHYIYSGSLEKLSTDNVFGLFAMSDKYQVDELKFICLEFIQSTLSVDTFCSVVRLALTYNLSELLKQAVDFFALNMAEVLQTVQWMNFMKDNHIQANELLLKSVLKNSTKQSCEKDD